MAYLKKQLDSIESKRSEKYGIVHTVILSEIEKSKKDLQAKVNKQLKAYFRELQGITPLEKFCRALSDEVQWLCFNDLNQYYSASVATRHYGYFIHELLKHKSVEGLNINSAESFYESFNQMTPSIFPVGNLLAEYLNFMEDIYEPYFYDDSVIPWQKDGEFWLFQSPIDYYHKWLNDSRPKILLALAKKLADNKIKQLSNSDDGVKLFKNYTKADVNVGIENLAVRYLITAMQLSDCQLNLKSGKMIQYDRMFYPLRQITISQNFEYNECLKKMKHIIDPSNITSCNELVPVFVLDKTKYDSFDHNAPWGDFEDFCEIFAYRASEGRPFPASVKPFVQINDLLFCPMSILSKYDSVYGFIETLNINVTTQNRKQQERSVRLERSLCEKLKNPHWDIEPSCGDNSKGDSDIILKDDKDVVLIQIKKPNFSFDSRKKYEDRVFHDEKAAQQLNDFEKSHTALCDKNQRVTKWIVSSFENCRNDIDGCRKVSYLDLYFWYDSNRFENLSQFIEAVQSDKPIRDIIDILKQDRSDFLRTELGKALPIVNPHSYMRRISTTECNNHYFQEIDDLVRKFVYSNGLEKLNIVDEVKKMCTEHSDNYMLWIFLGNCLVDVKDFCGAEESFKKVLEIVPDDPCTMRSLYILYTKTSWWFDSDEKKKIFIKEDAKKINDRFKELYWFVDEDIYRPDVLTPKVI